MSAITAKASRKMKKYAVLTREPRCFLGSFDFSWEQRKFSDITFPAGEKNRDNLPLESYSITNEHGFVPQDEKFENGGTMREADKRMYYIVSPNSFAYNPARINVGSIGYQNIGKNVIVSSLYEVFKTSEDVDDRLLWHWFKSPDFQKLIMQLQEGGVRLYFYYDKLCMGEVSLPSLEEQRKIGKLFDTLDNLITLHQRKCVFLFGLFQASISMIFTASTFSWEQRKVGDLLIERNQQAPMSDEYPLMAFIANEGVAPKGERYDRSALVTDTVNKLYKKTEKGDFIYSSNNLEAGSIGLNKYGKACISPVYCIFEPTGIADSDFLGRRLVRKDFINAMVKWRQGVIYGQWRIHESDFLKIEITVPSVEEQRKIGAYLDQLDNLITLHQRECISFTVRAGGLILTANKKRTTSSWEQRKLSEIADKVTEKNSGLQYVETFTNSAEFGIISQRDFFDHDIAKLSSLDGYYIVKNEDFVYNPRISTSAPVGPINRNKLGRTGVMSPLYTVFRPHDVDTTYLEHFFKCAYWHSFMNFNGDSGARSDRFSIKNDVFFQMPIPLPHIDEQRKIGELLTCLDHLITLHQRKPFLMKWRTSDANRNQTNRLVL